MSEGMRKRRDDKAAEVVGVERQDAGTLASAIRGDGIAPVEVVVVVRELGMDRVERDWAKIN